MSGRFERHDLVWLTRHGWEEALAQVSGQQRDAVRQWREQDGPLVVRRRDPESMEQEVCLGVALPAAEHTTKVRVAVRVAGSGVHRTRLPLTIGEVVAHAPLAWRGALAAMQADALGVQCGVFGSLAMQALTGQAYLRATSDIDMLFVPHNLTQLRHSLEILLYYDGRLPLDGEIVFPGGAAVAWKEWAQSAHVPGNHVLAKRRSDVALMRVSELTATLEEKSCRA